MKTISRLLRVRCRAPAGLAELALVGSVPPKPPATITPEFQEQLLHAYDSDEAVAAGRDHILTATPLSDDLKAEIVADSRDAVPEARDEWALHGIIQDITSQARAIEVPAAACRLASGRSAGISDGNRDGNDGSR